MLSCKGVLLWFLLFKLYSAGQLLFPPQCFQHTLHPGPRGIRFAQDPFPASDSGAGGRSVGEGLRRGGGAHAPRHPRRTPAHTPPRGVGGGEGPANGLCCGEIRWVYDRTPPRSTPLPSQPLSSPPPCPSFSLTHDPHFLLETWNFPLTDIAHMPDSQFRLAIHIHWSVLLSQLVAGFFSAKIQNFYKMPVPSAFHPSTNKCDRL